MIYLAVAHTSPFLTVYKRSGDTFTKIGIEALQELVMV